MIIRLPEKLTEESTRVLRARLESSLASKCLTIVLDFSDVREMNSAALETLLHCMNQVAQHDGTIRVSGMSPEAEIFLEFTRMDSIFAMFQEQPAVAPSLAVAEFVGAPVRDQMQVTAA